MKLKAVIFDLFGTLVNDFGSSAGQMNAELAAALAVPYEPFIQVWAQTAPMRTIGAFQTVEASIEHVCSLMGVAVEPEQIHKAVQIRLKYVKQALTPRADAVATIHRLKNDGYKVGLISNCSIEIPIVWLETAFAQLMDTAVFSSRACVKKPDSRIYHLACEGLGVAPESCLYIADGEEYELKGAANVGMHPVLLRNVAQKIDRPVHQEAREWQGRTVPSLTEVLDLVRKNE